MKQKESELKRIEKGLAKEQHMIQSEVKQEEKGLAWFIKSHTFKILLAVIIFIILIAGLLYLVNTQGRTYIDTAEVSAPIITLSPAAPGILDKVFVKAGDLIPSDMTVAEVNSIPIKSKIDGLVISVQNTPGQVVNSQTPVVQMIDPKELRVVGHIEENKGLDQIYIGQKVIFTIDAYGSREFNGTVESISPMPDESAIAFSISNNRAEKQFDVKVRFDINSLPELRNGMSARMWVYK